MTVSFTANKSFIKTFRPGDPGFTIIDGFMTSPRAGFEISNSCPAEYKSIFITAINAGWLKPVAHMHEREVLISGLAR
jgi:hypothetical protein